MLNPDGVRYGNYRSNLIGRVFLLISIGVDLNRRWINPSRFLHPTIFWSKKLIKIIHMERRVALYCDIHGHSRKKNVFMYGCHSPSSDIYSHRNNSLIRLIPYLMSQRSKIFCYNDCKFANEKEKEATARIVLFKEFGIVNSYTIESTFYGSDFLKESHPSNN